MTPDEYQQLALRTEFTADFVKPAIVAKDGTKLYPADFLGDGGMSRLLHGAFGACTETGELQDMIKKFLMYGKPFDRTNVLEECGDVLWYLAIALDACGYKMAECMQRNIEKLRKRFPDQFTQAQALTRNLDAERAALEGREVGKPDRRDELRRQDDKTTVVLAAQADDRNAREALASADLGASWSADHNGSRLALLHIAECIGFTRADVEKNASGHLADQIMQRIRELQVPNRAYDSLIEHLRKLGHLTPTHSCSDATLKQALLEAANAIAKVCGRPEQGQPNPMWVCSIDERGARLWHKVQVYDCNEAQHDAVCKSMLPHTLVRGAAFNIQSAIVKEGDRACISCVLDWCKQ
jgi:hypothetical protein